LQQRDAGSTRLSNYNVLVDMAAASGYISRAIVETLKEWRTDPASWGIGK
jgi:orotate phosphoribosyltransferase